MAQRTAEKLYTPRLLALSTELARFPLDSEFEFRSEARSRTCGSTIELGVDLDTGSKIARLGMRVSACAVGQSSAAIMALGAEGRGADEMAAMHAKVEDWLAGAEHTQSALPDWPGIDALEPALAQKGRHGALLLPWTALRQALSSKLSSR